MKGFQRTAAAVALLSASTLASAGLFGGSAKDVYIVQLDPNRLGAQTVSAATSTVLGLVGADGAIFEYDTVLKGFAAPLTERQARRLKRLALVSSIEKDRLIQVDGTQNNPIFNLDRIDETDRPLDGVYSYPGQAGAGVHIYVIDTGINPDHQDFGGRVGAGQNFVNDGPGGLGGLLPVDLLGLLLGSGDSDPNDWQDCHGHGTHVASTAAGSQYGVAKQSTVHAVRVLNCGGSGAGSAVIAGMEWVAENAERPAVVNMSLGGGASSAEDAAIANLYNLDILPVVAAGNDNTDACSTSPARAPEAMTVASSTANDQESSFSNHGACVDIIAPGSNIQAANYSNNSGSTTMSGTSMASPHVAGAAALLLGETNSLSAGDLTAALISNSTPGKVALSPANVGTPNLLLNVFPQGAKK